MGKLAEAIRAETRVNGSTCSVPAFLASLPKEIRADLEAALKAGVSTAPIARALSQLGHKIGDSTLRRHRRGDCDCGRSR